MDKFKALEAKAKAGLTFDEVFGSVEYKNTLFQCWKRQRKLQDTKEVKGYQLLYKMTQVKIALLIQTVKPFILTLAANLLNA